MFDTMTLTKTVSGLAGALLIFLLVKWAADTIYHTGAEGHGDEEHAMAYPIEVAEAEDTGAEAAEGPDFATLLAAADPAKGERVFGKCKACHKLDGSNGTGPHLDGVVGRAIGGVPDFNYSQVLAEHGGEWTPENLNGFLENPKAWAPGTKMSFAGLKKIEDRANVIAYLATVGG